MADITAKLQALGLNELSTALTYERIEMLGIITRLRRLCSRSLEIIKHTTPDRCEHPAPDSWQLQRDLERELGEGEDEGQEVSRG